MHVAPVPQTICTVAGTDAPATALSWPERIRLGRRLLNRVMGAAAPAEPERGEEPSVLVAAAPGARRAILTFGGNAGGLLLPRVVREEPGLHVIAVRDRTRRCFGLRGLDGLGDRYETSLDTLRQLLDRLDAREVFLAGASAGGYSALRFGLDLGADGVLGLCAPTTLDLADQQGASLARYPQLAALYRNLPAMPLDMLREYAAAARRPRIVLVYSLGHERDAWLAGRMAALPGVRLRPAPAEVGHRVMRWLEDSDLALECFGELWSLRALEV